MSRSSRTAALAALALALAACADAAPPPEEPVEPAVVVRVTLLTPAGLDGVPIVDVGHFGVLDPDLGVFPVGEAPPPPNAVRLSLVPASPDHDTWVGRTVIACDPEFTPSITVFAEHVGVFPTTVPAGAAPALGPPFGFAQSSATSPCVLGERTPLDVLLVVDGADIIGTPVQRGVVEAVVRAPGGAAFADAAFDVSVAGGLFDAVSRARLFGAADPDGVRFVGPCGPDPTTTLTVNLVGAWSSPVADAASRGFGELPPPGALRIWGNPGARLLVPCGEDTATSVVVVAPALREPGDDGRDLLRVGSMVCDTASTCPSAPEDDPAFEVVCTGPAPARLAADDLTVVCSDGWSSAIDPLRDATVSTRETDAGVETRWVIPVRVRSHIACGMKTRVLVESSGGDGPGLDVVDLGVPGGVAYPVLTLGASMSSASSCVSHRLGEGPLQVGYTSAEASEPTRFPPIGCHERQRDDTRAGGGRATRRSLRALLAALALTLGAPGCADGGGGGHAPSEPFAPGIDVRIALRSNVADIVPVVEVTRRDAIVNGVVATEITSLVDAGGGNYAGRLLFDCDPAVGTRVVLGARVLGYLPASVPPDGEATLHETRSSEFVAESVCATAVHHILTLKLAIVEP